MGLWSRLWGNSGPVERRAVIPLSGAVSVGDVEGMRTVFGGHLHDAAATAVAERCRSLISTTTASLPLCVFKRGGGGRAEEKKHPLWRLLNDESSDGVSAFSFREAVARDVLQFGNAIVQIIRNTRGEVDQLLHWPWGRVLPEQLPSGRLRWRVTGFDGVQRVLVASEVLHVKYASRDGVFGTSPLEWARTSTDLVTAQGLLARENAETGNVPLISFETDRLVPVETNDAAFVRLKNQLRQAVKFLRRGEPLLLDQGLHATPLSVSARDAQFLETRILGLEDVCRAFGVPTSVVSLGKSSSYGSLSEDSRSLVRFCLAPWLRLIEDQMRVALLTREDRRTLSLEHDLGALLRGSTEEEFKALQTAVGGPYLTADEAREWLGFNRTEGGDKVRFQMNTAPAAAGADKS